MILVTLMQSKKNKTTLKNNSNNNGMHHGKHSARFKLNSPLWFFSHAAFRFTEKIASNSSQDNVPKNSNSQQTSQLVVLHRGSPLHLCFADSIAITSQHSASVVLDYIWSEFNIMSFSTASSPPPPKCNISQKGVGFILFI